MPVVLVRCACGVCPEEWAMIELQGSIEIQQSALHQKLETLTIGSLCMRPGVLYYSSLSFRSPSLPFFWSRSSNSVSRTCYFRQCL
jgi:hypothetical protein